MRILRLVALPTTLFGVFASLFGRSPLGFFGMDFMALWPVPHRPMPLTFIPLTFPHA